MVLVFASATVSAQLPQDVIVEAKQTIFKGQFENILANNHKSLQ